MSNLSENKPLWKYRLIPVFILLLVWLILDVMVRNYADLTYEGEVPIVICVSEVIGLDTSEEIDQIVTVRVLSGPFRGEIIDDIPNRWTGAKYSDRILHKGDKLFLEVPVIRGGRVRKVSRYKLFSKIVVSGGFDLEKVLAGINKGSLLGNYFRSRFLLSMTMIFGGLLILVGGIKGLRAIGGLFVSGLAMLLILVPALAKGYNPLLIALVISASVSFVTFLIIGGISKKSVSGTLGTLGGLLACGLLALYFNRLLRFTGLDVNFGHMKLGRNLWRYETTRWNYRGLLTAGMVIGSLGAMMDVAMAISSTVTEVKKANPAISVKNAIQSGLNVGRDIMGTMANTLIFAYLGADMTILIMPSLNYGRLGHLHPFLELVNNEDVAVEITQALLGTIGLVLAIPITAVVAGLLTSYKVKLVL